MGSEADHYLHSSSRVYSGIKGVLDVEILERPMSLEGYEFSYLKAIEERAQVANLRYQGRNLLF